ncbi:MAG: hypothetical protein WKF96_20990 [Solirubrobacteraceae bacterium]
MDRCALRSYHYGTVSKSGQILVLGNLSLDLVERARVSADAVGAALSAGRNSFVDVSAELSAGGSAFLFASAAATAADDGALTIGAVGADPLGQVLVQCLASRGLATAALERVGAATPVIVVTYFEHGPRLLLTPSPTSNDALTPEWALDAAARSYARHGKPRLLFVSGHALRRPATTRFDATLELLKWARSLGIPVVLDLVPHRFRASVGPLEEVLANVGPVSGLVAEHETVVEVGLTNEAASLADAAVALRAAAAEFAVVQRKAELGVYEQAVASKGGPAVARYVYDISSERGLGDRLAVEALISLGILSS